MYRVFAFIGILIFTQCRVSKENHVEILPSNIVDSIAMDELGDRYSLKDNETKDFSIVSRKDKTLKDLIPSITFFVYAYKEEEIIFRDTLYAGYLKWEDTYSIKAISRKTKSGEKQKSIYLFNVLERSQQVIE